jgi:hypothetical protein
LAVNWKKLIAMLKKESVYLIGIFFLASAFILGDERFIYQPVKQSSISRGEILEYKINFGIFSIGKADMHIYPDWFRVNNRNCYKVDVFGKTTGAVDWIAQVDDNWGAYVDAEALVPHITWRNISEGKFVKKELVTFNHAEDVVEAKVVNNKTGDYKPSRYYPAPDNVRDLIGGFLFLRAVDFSSMKQGEQVNMHAFFEDTIYNFSVRYLGKDVVKTKAGKFRALKLEPVMPDNKLFNGKNSVQLWLSDDKNKIPLRAEARMFIGKAAIELTDFKGLKNQSNLVTR